MVEVFKTNVESVDHAQLLIAEIHKNFGAYAANFDLTDCDKVLRIQSKTGIVDCNELISLLRKFGFNAEVLPDEIVSH
ncbi:hypothetical protein [Chryseosolibacter indicus]|uniref:Uncharacterized protein n=1 Tax=Chryseosolibacter indicus TaxID=2782351 RepID=A0ABS5VQH6_9BACT|nr:hypothetical protein [Chryseosolibacter indicus]MBT1703693.1 hypothetical protein [Chryseosolibacter indicus]